MEGIGPGAIGRCHWETEQTHQDLELLWWIGRFRFVTAEQIAVKLGCSVQRANARARRLEKLALVGRERAHPSQPRAVFLTGRGHELLGLPRRRAPRAELRRDHEAAIVDLALELDRRAGAATTVLTERECRQHDANAGAHARYSVQVVGDGRGDQRRWPDLVVSASAGRVAVELELTPKGTRRLQAIVAGYRASTYAHVVFAVRGDALRRRVTDIARVTTPSSELTKLLALRSCAVEVLPWQHGRESAGALARLLLLDRAC